MSSELQARLRIYCFIKFDYYEKIEIPEFAPISANAESSVYGFSMSYEEQEVARTDALILKAFNDDMYGKDRALKERHALKQLHHRGYPVPRPVASEIDAGHIGMPFILMERVPGRLLGDVLQTAPEAEQRRLLTPFVQLLTDLHTMKVKALVGENFTVPSEYTLIKRELYNLRGLVTSYEPLEAVLGWLNARRERVPCKRPSINHRDFHPWNVLLSDDDKLSVIDWGWQIGDPRSDLGWLLAKLEREELGVLSEFALSEYERLDGAPVEQTGFFRVLGHLRWMAGVAQDLKVNRALQNGSESQVRAVLQPRLGHALTAVNEETGLTLPTAEELLNSFKEH